MLNQRLQNEGSAPLPPALAPMGGTGVPHGLLYRPPLPFQYPSIVHLSDRVAVYLREIELVEGRAPGTIRWMRGAFGHFRRFLNAEGKERAFLAGDMERQVEILGRWVAAMRVAGLSRVTINNTWRALRSLFQRIQLREGKVNPLALVPAPRPGKSLPRCLPWRDAERLLAFVRGADWGSRLAAARNLAVVGVMLLAGLRLGEVLALECADVDAEGGTLQIRHGKGRDGGKARTAYAPPQLQQILTGYISLRRAAGRATPAFFTGTYADRPMGVIEIRRICAAGSRHLETKITPHMLRHTFATLLRQSGVPDRVAMELLGHSSLQMLQRYSHVFEGEHLREAAKLRLDVSL